MEDMKEIRVHWWGVQVGGLSVIWWDMWSGVWCWHVSRVREP